MSSEGLKFAVELVGAAAVIYGVILVLRLSKRPAPAAGPVAGIALAALLCVSLLLHVRSAASVVNQARLHAVGAQAGLEECLNESLDGSPVVPERSRFLAWVKRRLPAHAIYTVTPYAGPPDSWCLTLVLLPALPAGAGDQAGWTIAPGTASVALEARIARHDPHVHVFAPGYVLAQNLRG